MALQVSSVTLEHHRPGRLGIGERAPRISWMVAEAAPEYEQRGARIAVERTRPDGVSTESVHEVDGAPQVLVDWQAEPLGSREAVAVRVQVTDGERWSDWSEAVTAETGLLEPSDWEASFVGPGWVEPDADLRRPPRLRHEFTIDGAVRHARAYVSAHGLIELEINGARVGDEELTPGWTSYRHRLRYATFDVTDLIHHGVNAVGAWLGDGWWRGRIGYAGGQTDVYGADIAGLVQLEITLQDGRRVVVASDGEWRAAIGPIISSGLYDGERFDARLDDATWSMPGAAGDWSPVSVHPLDPSILVAPTGPAVRVVDELRPIHIERRESGRWLLDFGQNHSGRLRLKAEGPAGHVVRIRHAEVLQHGELHTETLRTARATDELVLPGGAVEWEPRFTIHGYRYAELSGWPGELGEDDVVSRVIHTDMVRTGWFDTSSELINRLHENVVWSLRSNFVDLPTDCPQRDERLGWTGDIQVFAPSATFLYDVTGLLAGWLQDLSAEQAEHDWVPPFVPYLPLPPWTGFAKDPTAVWGDVAVLTPAVLFEQSGDRALLRRQYASAAAWLEHVERAAGPSRICEGTVQLGDWLDPNAPADDPMKAMTDPALVATAYFAHSATVLSAVAAELGERDDAGRYARLAEEVRQAFAERYMGADGRLAGDTQTAYALTTTFDLWPSEDAERAGTRRLAELVGQARGRISTGFAGTPVVSDALSETGHLAEAYRLLECTEAPSWLYSVVSGATTVWERWDSLLPDGTVYPGEMTSFNHYALGAVADWLHRVVAGIAADAPAWRRIRFAPRPGGSLTRAAARHTTPFGVAGIRWELGDDTLRVEIEVPPGATAIVDLPGVDGEEVGHGTHAFEVPFETESSR
ncbi:alpha-L-rhamnosidase [Agromyces sp. Soil535]|uniref:alpha-L-rhamnosidase n=1 Tax=Agromyces sp. Soil535 TaxID=1736390 RepID=UPI0006F7B9BC|nr:alpha-L-rhamnosidase [Agromyces sp. Soil535]KRE30833.1 alpha-L-rhamnosidase [Agromyces sp. Soil535]